MNFSRETGILLFRFVIPIIILSIQYFLYRKTSRWAKGRFPGSPRVQAFALAPFLLFNVALLGLLLFRPRTSGMPSWFIVVGVYPFIIWHAATFFVGLLLFVFTLLKLPVKGALLILRRAQQWKSPVKDGARIRGTVDTSRRAFLRRGMYGLTAFSFAGSAYGLLHEKNSYELTRTQFLIPDLHPSLHGFTISLISDIHSSMFMTREEMEEYVRRLNSLQSDLIVIPGDFVNSQTDEVYPFAEAFAACSAPCGVYGVMGNHDFYAGNPELVAREVDGCGVRLLRNDSIMITKAGAQFALLGIDDAGTPQSASSRMDAALQGVPSGVPRILLSHRPYFLPQAAERRIDLVLSGHTHGGQLVFGHVGNVYLTPAALASPYVWGPYRLQDTHMYVSRGIGTVALPLRINCPPEITQITLWRHASASTS